MEEPELLTIENAARAMQVGRSTMYSWIAEGLVPTFRVNGVVRIPRSALIRLIDEQVVGATTRDKPEEASTTVDQAKASSRTKGSPA